MLAIHAPFTARDVRALISAFRDRDENALGGNLHLVIEDGNLDDGSVQMCLDLARKNGDAIGEVIAAALLTMTEEQRDRATMSEFWAEHSALLD